MKVADLFKPMTLPKGANIDPRYWTDNGDGTYTPTALLVYNISRDAVEYFKKNIVKLDKEEVATTQYGKKTIKVGDYHYRDCNVTIVDTYINDMLSREHEIKYGEQLKEINKKWKEYQRAHPDEFDITYGVQMPDLGGHDENSYFNGFKPEDMGLSLADAVAVCSAAMNLLQKYKSDGDNYADLPMVKFDRYMSKSEFKDKHKAYRQNLMDEAGIPAVVEIPKEQLPTITGDSEAKFRNKNYEKPSKKPEPGTITIPNFEEKIANSSQDEETFGKFATGLIAYITSTTREQHMSALADKIRTIGAEFANKFNDVSKFFKAEESSFGYDIYKKGTEQEAPEKYMVLLSMGDHWDGSLCANVDGLDIKFKGVVNNYEDFKKILRAFAKILDTSELTDLAEDLLNVVDTL